MKNRNRQARSPVKLGIHKDKLRVVPDDRLREISGGGDPPSPPGNPHPDSIGSWY